MQRHELKTDQAFYEAVYETFQPEEFDPFEESDWRMSTSLCSGQISNRRLLDGLSITLFDIVTYKPINFSSQFLSPRVIELGFVTSGTLEYAIQGCRREFDSIEGQNYLTLIEGDVKLHTIAPADQNLKFIEVRFTPESLDQFCSQIGERIPTHLKQCFSQTDVGPYKCASVLSLEMNMLVQEIYGNWYAEQGNPLYLESKSYDLLAAYIAFANGGMPTKLIALSPRDIEQIRAARTILDRRLTNPPSLTELARLVHLNDFKLKLGFRQAFGTTTYAYLKETRLQQAQILLRDYKKSVTETAFEVGYRNIGDFGIAFKRRFGVSPRYAHRLKNP